MLVQVNARVPEDGREAMLSIAAKLRDDASFAKRLLAFLDDDVVGSPWADRFAALEERVRVLEASAVARGANEVLLLIDGEMERGAGGANNPHGLGGKTGKTEGEVQDADPDIVNVDNIHVDKEGRPTGTSRAAGMRRLQKAAEDTVDEEAGEATVGQAPIDTDARPLLGDGERGAEHHGWAARAAAVTLSTGEGRGRKLTPEGIALFEEMAGAGVGSAEIAKVLGMARQSVDTRRAKLTARE